MKKKLRPPQKLFLASDYSNVDIKRDKKHNNLYSNYYKGNVYIAGFLHKKVTASNLKFDNVTPTLEEL
jgi:transcription elongation factor